MVEIWKTIKENPNYMVSNLGRIKSLDHYVSNGKGTRMVKGKVFTGAINRYGYINIHIVVNGKEKNIRLNRLIAQTFIPNPHHKEQVNHLNGNKSDNRVENLEWATRSENGKHAYKMGLLDKKSMIKNWDSFKKPIAKVRNGQIIEKYQSMTEARIKNNMSISSLCNYAKNNKKDRDGNEWRYL